MSSPQPNVTFDIDKVSGFYGPGTWAGALLAIAATWYSTIRRPERSPMPSILAPLLLTNWAAIDLLVQTHATEIAPAPTIAAVAVSFWGLWHMLLQEAFILFRRKESATFWIARMLLPVGCIVPFVALVSTLHRTQSSTAGDPWSRWWKFVDFATLFLLPLSMWGWSNKGILATTFLVCRDVIWVTLSCHALNWVLVPYAWGRERGARNSCFFIPCAPQGIKEWDQAFSLLIGLTLFVYEVVSDVWAAARKREDVVLPVASDEMGVAG